MLHILRRGIMDGWTMEDETGLPPEALCGLFVCCRCLVGVFLGKKLSMPVR